MADQHINPPIDIVNDDSTTVDVNTLHPVFKAPGIHTKHNGLLRPPMIAVYMNGTDDPLFLKIDKPMTFGRDTSPQPQPALIEFGPTSLEQGVSRQHARVSWQNGQLFIEDLGSSNGTFINQVQLEPYVAKPLSSGDVVQLGQMALEIYFDPELPTTDQMPLTNIFEGSRHVAVESSAPQLPASMQPALVEYVRTLPLSDGQLVIDDLQLNAANQIAPNDDITLKLRQVAEGNSTLVLEIALTDPVVQKAIQAIFTDKAVFEITELKVRINKLLG